jgi:hypothetical protein
MSRFFDNQSSSEEDNYHATEEVSNPLEESNQSKDDEECAENGEEPVENETNRWLTNIMCSDVIEVFYKDDDLCNVIFFQRHIQTSFTDVRRKDLHEEIINQYTRAIRCNLAPNKVRIILRPTATPLQPVQASERGDGIIYWEMLGYNVYFDIIAVL